MAGKCGPPTRTRGFGRTALVGILVTPILLLAAWSWGHREVQDPTVFRVTGGSMAPTLVGRTVTAHCTRCGLDWIVDSAASSGDPDRPICAHCGASLAVAEELRHGDIVQIGPRSADSAELSRGDLVAIQRNNQLHIKRIAALPGDTVDVDQLQLIVRGKPLQDLLWEQASDWQLPMFLVDQDNHRVESRWKPAKTSDRGWSRAKPRRWTWEQDHWSPWLIYHHLSIHDYDRPSPVWDDYPFNATLTRRLHEVDRFIVQCVIEEATTATIEIAFWSHLGSLLATREVRGPQPMTITTYDGAEATSLPVTSERPIAIRVQGRVSLENLTIHRLVQYRLRPGDDRNQYPLHLGSNECYVVGDNVPISVDSRDFGAISVDDIRGVVVNIRSQVRD